MIKIRKKKLASGMHSLYLDIYVNGSRKYEFLQIYLDGNKKHDKLKMQLAEEIRHKREAELIASGNKLKPLKSISFYDYLDKKIELNPQLTRAVNIQKRLKEFAPELQFDQINSQFWEEFRHHLINEKDYKLTTISTALAILKNILNRAVKDNLITENPLAQVKQKRVRVRKEYLTLDEVKLLAETECRFNSVKQAFLFACFSGLRLIDLESFKRSDVVNNQINITQEKTDDPIYIPLSTQAKKYLPEDKFNLPARSTILTCIREWSASAGIKKKVTFHTSRHTFATLAVTYGIDIAALSKLLGHANIKTTQIYAQIIDDKLKESVGKIPEF